MKQTLYPKEAKPYPALCESCPALSGGSAS
jgi:hypothetical protein